MPTNLYPERPHSHKRPPMRPVLICSVDQNYFVIGESYNIKVSMKVLQGEGLLKDIEIYLNNTLYKKIDITNEGEYECEIDDIIIDSDIRVIVFDTLGSTDVLLKVNFNRPIYYGVSTNLVPIDEDMFPVTLTFNDPDVRGKLVIKYPKRLGNLISVLSNGGDEYIKTLEQSSLEIIGGCEYLVYKAKYPAVYRDTKLTFYVDGGNNE